MASSDVPAIKCGPVIVQGVAFTDSEDKNIWVAVRPKDDVPEGGGIWMLSILSVDGAGGQTLGTKGKLAGTLDVTRAKIEVAALAELEPSGVPETVVIKGELVHCLTVEEDALFPEVTLETRSKTDPENERHPAMRDWFVPDNQLVGTRTPLGLELRYKKMGGWGYSGPGYDDLSFLPVGIVPETLDSGVRDLLAKSGTGSVERVDAETRPDSWRTVYRKVPAVDNGLFSDVNEKFQRVVTLKLHVRRLIADQRYPFALQVQVQRDKDLYEQLRATPNPAKIVAWPGDPIARATKPGSP